MPPKRIPSGVVKFIGAVEDEWELYSDNASDYILGRPIGFGASSIVYQAEYRPPSGESMPCALKVLDLDSLPRNSLRLLRKETQLMSLSKHPNVLRVRGTWIEGHKLYIALRLMRSGSVADVMQYAWPEGVEEAVAKCVLKQALEGLNYLHINGFIHRDIKAANLLIDDDGTVLLGDLGVATALNDDDTVSYKSTVAPAPGLVTPRPVPANKAHVGKRKSFVGTPCWMAPEVASQRHYDSKADIWSLGITALELAQGRPPRAREDAHAVLIKTIQDEPPTLNRNGGQFKYSKAFKELIQSCLRKDPSKRPTAEELLHTAFFKSATKKSYLETLLSKLPPLVDRQERRRIPSSLTHLSMESWDFSQGGLGSPTLSQHPMRLCNEGVFEMDELKEIPSSSDENRHVITVAEPLSDAHIKTKEFLQRKSIDEGPSTPSVSPASSYHPPSAPASQPSNSAPRARSDFLSVGHPSPPAGSASTSPSTSPSTSQGIWKKLKGMGKMSDRDERSPHSFAHSGKRLSPSPPLNQKRRVPNSLSKSS